MSLWPKCSSITWLHLGFSVHVNTKEPNREEETGRESRKSEVVLSLTMVHWAQVGPRLRKHATALSK